MLKAFRTNKFNKDVKRSLKRRKDLNKLEAVIDTLIYERPLDRKLSDHPLKGNYNGCRECHIEPDWLLIYFVEEKSITFVRTGTHADLFE